jgi:hypothetical protein
MNVSVLESTGGYQFTSEDRPVLCDCRSRLAYCVQPMWVNGGRAHGDWRASTMGTGSGESI